MMTVFLFIPVVLETCLSTIMGLEITELLSNLENSGLSTDVFKYALHVFRDVYDRPHIRETLVGVSGIYCRYNLVNGRFYIGKGKKLYVRVFDYYRNYYLNHSVPE